MPLDGLLTVVEFGHVMTYRVTKLTRDLMDTSR